MPAASDLERRVTTIVDNAYGLQGMICTGCTNLFYRQAKFVGGQLELSDPECLNPDCPGYDPVAAYTKGLQTLARFGLLQTEEIADAST